MYDAHGHAYLRSRNRSSGLVTKDVVAAGHGGGTFGNANVGTNKPMTASGLGLTGADGKDYLLTQPAGLGSIPAKALTITGVAGTDKVYDTTTADTPDNAGEGLTGVVAADLGNVSITNGSGAFLDANAGNGKTVSFSGYGLAGSAASNYTLSGQPAGSTANITAAPLTVTANNAGGTYGGTVGALTYNTVGLLGSDTLSGGLTVATVGGAGSTITANVGTQAINQGTLSNDNYAITYNAGTFTINPATLTVTADNQHMLPAAVPTLTDTITGFVLGQNLNTSGVTGAATLSTAADSTSPIGNYAINAAQGTLAASNYTFSFVNGTLSIAVQAPAAGLGTGLLASFLNYGCTGSGTNSKNIQSYCQSSANSTVSHATAASSTYEEPAVNIHDESINQPLQPAARSRKPSSPPPPEAMLVQ